MEACGIIGMQGAKYKIDEEVGRHVHEAWDFFFPTVDEQLGVPDLELCPV